MMTRDELIARKNTLEAMRQQHLANANACAGAIQECDHWLGELERAEAQQVMQGAEAEDV